MKNFREAYKEAVNSIQMPSLTQVRLADEGRRRQAIWRRRRRLMAAATAVCAFLLCTAGGAAAAGYARSVIRADEHGFQTADARTARLNGWGEGAACDAPQAKEGIAAASFFAQEELAGAEAEAGAGESGGMEMAEAVETEPREYRSYGEFAEAEQIPLALPGEALPGESVLLEEYIVFDENFLLVRIETEGHIFMMDQSYYGDTTTYASSTVYPDGVCNEREYTTAQGFTYTVLDSVRSGGEPLRIHAAVAIGDYELIVNFDGYSEEEAFAVLEAMDLTVYL